MINAASFKQAKRPSRHQPTATKHYREIFTYVKSTASSTRNNYDRKKNKLEMWANAQCDGRPAEHRWHPLFNAANFG